MKRASFLLGTIFGICLGMGMGVYGVSWYVTEARKAVEQANLDLIHADELVRQADCLTQILGFPSEEWWQRRRAAAHRLPVLPECK